MCTNYREKKKLQNESVARTRVQPTEIIIIMHSWNNILYNKYIC